MGYVNINDSEALASALVNGGPVNIKRDGSAEAPLSVRPGAPTGYGDLGQMNIRSERESVRGAVRIVYSYLTPIAWELADGRWVVSVQHYSASTRQHQRTIAAAISHAYDKKRGPATLDGRDGFAVLNGSPKNWPAPAAA